MKKPAPAPIAPTLQAWFAAGVRRDATDLSARQMAVLLTVYATTDAGTRWTVRGLATHLNVSKPAITRALDRLGDLYLIERKIDPMDRRSVDIIRTATGKEKLRQIEQDWTAAVAAQQQEAANG